MENVKRLRSVVQSIAHHSISGLCYLHPHLGRQCRDENIKTISYNLVNHEFKPVLRRTSREIELSSHALIEKFEEIMAREGLVIEELKSLELRFIFDDQDYARFCHAVAKTSEGKVLEADVSTMGEIETIIGEHS